MCMSESAINARMSKYTYSCESEINVLMRMNTHTRESAYKRTYEQLHTRMKAHINVLMRKNTHTRMKAHINVLILMFTYILVKAHINVCMRMYTHTHVIMYILTIENI